MNSEALALKNGTFASSAVAREQGLSGARSSGEQDPLRSTRTQAAILLRVLQEVDDFIDFCLHLVDPGDIVERHSDRLGIDALLFPAPEEAAHSPLLPSKHPHVERDEQQDGRERNEKIGKEPALLHERGRTHRRSSLGQLSEEVVGCERRPLGGEPLIRLILLARECRGLLQFALDGVAAGEEGPDVLRVHLILELGVGQGPGPASRS
jgi:hypothetical protein